MTIEIFMSYVVLLKQRCASTGTMMFRQCVNRILAQLSRLSNVGQYPMLAARFGIPRLPQTMGLRILRKILAICSHKPALTWGAS
jgi:hypothetical protein